MSEGPSIQHKASFKNEAGFAFEDGERVPIVEEQTATDEPPDKELSPPRLDSIQLLETILHGARNPVEISAKALVLGMIQGCPSAPKTQTEFAALLGISRTTGQRLWARLFECLQADLAVFGHGRALVDERRKFESNAAGTKPG
jgi:hypothetical protein